jgi:outer membrane lipoprotein-sorting protein
VNLLALVVAALLLPQEKNEAETLFKKMEEKITKAATVRLKMTGGVEAMKLTLSGDLLLGEGSNMRIDLEGKTGDKSMTAGLVTDGKRLRLEATGQEPKSFDVADKLGPMYRTTLARGGLQGTLDSFDGETGVKGDPADQFVASGFKMGAKEKVGAREAQAVDYKLEKKGQSASEATVWIDLETHLPLKRTAKMGDMTLSETYAEFKLDEKIDPAKFELPK